MIVQPSKSRIKSIIDGFENKKVLVVGDLMVDRYLWGQVSRLSPEAPVPIVEIEKTLSKLGGAANVGNNIASLGGIPLIVGLVGDDRAGQDLLEIVNESGFITEGIICDSSRPTTEKTRVIAHSQHVVRTDHEDKSSINAEIVGQVQSAIRRFMNQCDAVIMEDYNKGLITEDLIRFVIKEARKQNKILCVDPKFDHFFSYVGATVFKPNRRETELILGVRLNSREHIAESAKSIQEKLSCKYTLITLGEDGMAAYDGKDPVRFIPTNARRVADVSGAGDTTISTLTLALTTGVDFDESAALANYAAGIVCGEVGIVPITREKLLSF